MKVMGIFMMVLLLAGFFCVSSTDAQVTTTTTTTTTKTVSTSVTPGTSDGTFDRRLVSINSQAQGDPGGFVSRTASHFAVAASVVEGLLARKMPPADVYMSILISSVTKRPVGQVVEVYDANKGKGWGVIAKQMGIKPGSAEFHALKKDNFSMKNGNGNGKGKDKNKGKGKGKNKDKWQGTDD
jgi:spore germination protein YaaH